jgi:hypothetical protein
MRVALRPHSLIETVMLLGYSLVDVVRARLATARRT